MARWMMLLVAAFAVVYTATILIVGDPLWLIPGAILLCLIVGYTMIERALTKAHMKRHHDDPLEAQRDDQDWAIPSAHLIPDDQTGAGDTPEAHDEISPHDLPPDHPGRAAAEAQAGGMAGTTTGNESGAQGGRFERGDDRTAQRTGERQRSATGAKQTGSPGEAPGEVEGDEPKYFPS